MPRTTRGLCSRRRHKRLLARTRGFRGRRNNVLRVARLALFKAGQYAYRDRRVRKRTMRSLWIVRINAGARAHGMTYRSFMYGLACSEMALDRKVLADLALHNPDGFTKLAQRVKASLVA